MIRPAPEPEIRGFLFFCIFPSVRFSLHVPILVSAPILAHAAPWACKGRSKTFQNFHCPAKPAGPSRNF